MKVLAVLGLGQQVFALQDSQASPRLPTRLRCRQLVASSPWGKLLSQIPSTVVDKGVLRNIPYTSYAAGDYELNVYGDPNLPCCFEIGLHRGLLNSAVAKRHCLDTVSALLDDPQDRKVLASLNLSIDKKVRGGLTFEVTPPTAEDAYGGWWVSVYVEEALDRSRAAPQELEKITVSRQEVRRLDGQKKPGAGMTVESVTEGRWGAEDLSKARNRTDMPEEKQKVYAPIYSRKNGVYVPDRTIEDTGYIMFICAGSDRHEDREEIVKVCPSCKKMSTFFWESSGGSFVCFQCGAAYDNSLVKCSLCGKVPRRVRIKHR